MRIGFNPEKLKKEKIHYYNHRIIIPVYIPNIEEEFYKDSLKVLKKCLESLFKTIDNKTTAITIINNNCCNTISNYLNGLLKEYNIQKISKYAKNKGKVYTILSEIKSSYEEYITVTDADVFFMDSWLSKTIEIFDKFPNAAFVSPLPFPYSYSYLNRPLLIKELINVKIENKIDKKSFDLFEKGVNPKQGYFQGRKWDWRLKQYILKKKKHSACVGATHFVFTVKKTFLEGMLKGPEIVFQNGDENEYIEKFVEKNGGYRLSTTDTNVYHMGNTLERWIENYKHKDEEKYFFTTNNLDLKKNRVFSFFIVKVLCKLLKNKLYKN